MKKNYLTPEVELFEVQQQASLLSVSEKLPVEENAEADGNGDDETVKDFVFEW